MTRIFVTLGQGRQVPDPENGGKLLAAGEVHTVPSNAYWQRRLKDQDVTLADPPAQALEATEPLDTPAPIETKIAKRSAAK